MNNIDNMDPADPGPGEVPSDGDDRLRWSLRGMRRDAFPQQDLWPRIAARIAAESATPPSVKRRGAARFIPWAMAASLLLAVALVWQLRPVHQDSGAGKLIAREAQAMTSEYRGALRELSASAPTADAVDPALHELDRSAVEIRNALERDPEARFLLDRLRHTYSLRLALTQRAVFS